MPTTNPLSAHASSAEVLASRPLEIPPPPPSPATNLRRALQLLRRMREDPTQTELGMEMVEALGGYFDGDAPFQQFARSRLGRRLLQEKPDLPAMLADRDGLESLSEESFGRAFQRYCDHNGISPAGLLEMRRSRGDLADADPLRTWFADRQTACHDLWHVLTGYGTDPIGENALLLFTRGQGIAGLGLRRLTNFMLLYQGWRVRRFIWAAYRRGRRAPALILASYEELLPLPLALVRERLGLGAPGEAHPEGILELTDGSIVRAGRVV